MTKTAKKATPKKSTSKVKKPIKKNTKETHDKIASLGSIAMKHPKQLSLKEIKSMGASLVSQSNPNANK